MKKISEQYAKAFWEIVEDTASIDAFVALIKERGLQPHVPAIMRTIKKLGERKKAELSARVTTAFDLGSDIRTEIEKDLGDYNISFDTNSDIIGGIEVSTFDTRISGTVQSMLQKLQHSFSK